MSSIQKHVITERDNVDAVMMAPTQLETYRAIRDVGPSTAAEVGEKLGIGQKTATMRLYLLEAMGYVERDGSRPQRWFAVEFDD